MLPGGLERDGEWQRTVWLRPLTGRDEVMFTELPGPGQHWVTGLLGAVLSLDGGATPAGVGIARALTVGDREAALLQLRRLTIGDNLSCVLVCPACGEKLDLDLRVTDLLLPPYPYAGRLHHAAVDDRGERFQVSFRLPTGADLEQIAPLTLRDMGGAIATLIERCVEKVTGTGARHMDAWPAVARRYLPGIMAHLDPQAVVDLDAVCPACRAAFVAPFDMAQFISLEMTSARDDLFREVHRLALHYHWSEPEILTLTRRRRRRYLKLLAETTAVGTG